jgi:hypothetical protein
MPTNEVVLVDAFLSQAQAARDEPLPDSTAFEIFAAQMELRDRQLSDDEIEAGRIGGGMDGAIDGVYVFLDGVLLDEDSDVFNSDFDATKVRKSADLEFKLIQAKTSQGFAETAIDLASSSLSRFLDLNRTDDDLRVYYSNDALARMRIFTRAWVKLSSRSPRISIRFAYVTRGDRDNVVAAVVQKQRDLEAQLRNDVPGVHAEVELIGARQLWAIADAAPEYDLQLRFSDYLSKGDSYTGLVGLADYYEFLCDANGTLRSHLFDWNVRDYQGKTSVNSEILATLESPSAEDFWWLNNGVTILCSDVNIGGDKTFTMENVQIVNGMQTSHSIHTAITRAGVDVERDRNRSVQVRVFETQDEETRDRVIRATNSQTKVPDASLHATEDIHRQIESYFASRGWWYDRRKNFHRNQGRPADRIVSISNLGQAIMAIGLGRPHDARARPSSLLNNEADYRSLFNPNVPLQTYLWLAQVQRQVDTLLLRVDVHATPYLRTNLRFHVSLYMVTQLFGAEIHSPAQLNELASTPPAFTPEQVKHVVELLDFENQASADHEPLDRASKSGAFARQVIEVALGNVPPAYEELIDLRRAHQERRHRSE